MSKKKKATCPYPGCGRPSEHSGDHRPVAASKPKRRNLPKFSKKHENFCQFFVDSGNATQSAILAGLSGQWGRILVHQPKFEQRIAEIRKRFSERREARRVEKALLTEGFTDQQVMQLMVAGQTKPYQLKACELAYKKLKLIEPEHGPRAYAGAFAGQPGTLGGATMQEVYKAKWLRDKELALAAQNEAEFNEQKQLIEGNPQNA